MPRGEARGTWLARPRSGSLLRAALLAACLTAGWTGGPAALAAEQTRVMAGVVAGPLTVSVGAPRLGEASLTGDGQHEISGDLGAARVVDARGSGEGWSLRVTATVEAAPGAPPLAGDALTIVAVEVAPEAGSAPLNEIGYPLALPLAPGAAPTRVFSAAPGTGMGTVALRPEVRLRLPADAPPGAYSAHLTVGVVAGP